MDRQALRQLEKQANTLLEQVDAQLQEYLDRGSLPDEAEAVEMRHLTHESAVLMRAYTAAKIRIGDWASS